MSLLTLATTTTESSMSTTSWIIILAIALIGIIAMWRVFEKAKQPGWASIIPIYNIYVLLKIANRPGWWLLLYLIPFVNIITHAVVSVDIAKAFGKSSTFGIVGLWIFSAIGFLILGYGSATYKGAPKR
jgi:hypothetical protein